MTEYVSLGGNCSVSHQLIKRGYCIRYPFDWAKVSIVQLNKVLFMDFMNYHKLDIKKFSENHPHIESKSGSFILKNSYNITFAHEIAEKYNLQEFIETLQRRMKRWNELKNPTFIRIETENLKEDTFIKQYNCLVDNIKVLFPTFTLIVIATKAFSSKYIRFINLEKFSADWKYDSIDWDYIIKKIDK